MGLHLDDTNIYDPANYDNYVLPPPLYLNEFQRAAQIMSGGNMSAVSSVASSDRLGDPFYSPFGKPLPAPGFVDRFGQWGSAPTANAPVTSDDPQNFAGRFEKWASSPAGALGNIGAPASQPTPNPGKRSDIPDNVTPTSARPTPSVWPFLAANASGFGGVSKYAAPNGIGARLPPPDPDAPGLPLSGSAGDDNVPERRLVGRVVNLSAPASSGAPPLVPNQAASTSPLLGLFSGQPMPDWPVPPPIFQTSGPILTFASR